MRFDKTAEINGISLRYETSGTGDPAILLLHGLGSDPGALRGTVASLSATFRVIVPIQRGHVPSGTVPPYTNDQLVDDALRLVEKLAISSLVAVGYSRGAQTALALAAERPDIVKGVVSLGGVSHADEATLQQDPALFASIERDGLDRFAENVARMLVSRKGLVTNPSLRDYAKLNMARHAPDTMIRLLRDYHAADIRPLLPKVKCPVVLVVGADDQMCSLRSQIELKARLEQCVVRVLPSVGHDYVGEAVAEVNALIAEFVAGLT